VGAAVLPLMAARARAVDPFGDKLTHDLLVGLGATGALGSLLLIALAEPLTRVVGGPELAGASHSLTLLAPTGVVLLVAIPLGTTYLALGRGRRYLHFNALALLFNVVANAAFTLPFGIDAAARITWATELAVAAAASLPLWRRDSGARHTALGLTGLLALVVAGSELAAAGADPRIVAGAGALVILALTGGRLRCMLGALRRPSAQGVGALEVAAGEEQIDG
ncbi:MAG: hypothetical protein QOH90_2290, partial [Actinomycetota bacterium]|nr:hypothetical protein [Actinomycetota bacterium]